jgi:hypothetical protein
MSSDNNIGFTRNSGRGTLDLIQSCLVTIILCTWYIQRLQFVGQPPHQTTTLRRKIFWFLITLLCPEYIAWIAFDQWQRARKYSEVQELGHNDWTMQHGFYVDMGCFEIDVEDCSDSLPGLEENLDIIKIDGGFRFTIRLEDLISLMRANLISAPDIGTNDLKERDKSDQFARTITFLQILNFAGQFFSRLGYHLPISALELSTIAFVCPAMLVEYFWWYKPLDLRTGTLVKLDAKKNEQFISICSGLRFNSPEQDLAEWSKGDFALFFDRLAESTTNTKVALGLLIALLTNGIHILAWNNSFPSEMEQLLWRIASTAICGAILLLWIGTNVRIKPVRLALCSSSIVFYLLCRLFIMVETFVALRSVPESLYQTVPWPWWNFI